MGVNCESSDKMGGRVGDEMQYGEMVTHASGGKALIYSLCLFWVIYWEYMRVSISAVQYEQRRKQMQVSK